MTIRYPQRIDNHQLEEISVRFFNSCLPKNWTSEKPAPDYGVDLRVDLYHNLDATGLELLVQLKASGTGTDQEYEKLVLDTSAYNYLRDKLQVVMLVKYVESEKKAYWLLLKDVPEPNQEQKTFTIRIPKENVLESIKWDKIYEYVDEVTEVKLAVTRRNQMKKRNA